MKKKGPRAFGFSDKLEERKRAEHLLDSTEIWTTTAKEEKEEERVQRTQVSHNQLQLCRRGPRDRERARFLSLYRTQSDSSNQSQKESGIFRMPFPESIEVTRKVNLQFI